MSSVILDSDVLERLRQPGGLVEIRDKMGQLAGYFTPPAAQPTESGLYLDVEIPFTDADLDRLEQEPGGRTLDEILKDLEKRA
jgi:hypothetical protein